MIKLQGSKNSAVVYADKIDKQAKTQIAALLRSEAYADSKIRIMPDVHAGRNVPVGTTMTLSGRVSPSLVGVDIGCGMETVFLKERDVDLRKLDEVIHAAVPCGAKIHERAKAFFDLGGLYCRDGVDEARAQCSLGTLGSGNHFIELDRSKNGDLVLVIHTGSRQLGSDAAAYYQEQAYRYQCKKARRQTRRQGDGYAEEERFCRSVRRERKSGLSVRREDAVLEGDLFEKYLHDIHIITAFAHRNRETIAARICDAMGFTVKERFSCVHNCIDPTHGILRKGATSARLGERVIIPLNMRDGAILGTGLGNPAWNFSAPHGAGRVCNRTEAQFAFTVEEYQKEMAGIYTTTAQRGSLDECPMAYKEPQTILDRIRETVSVEEVIKPIYNFKSC